MAELFGHERGAFTDAARARIGRLRAADGATLVLDEISEAPAALQAALLRVVEQGEVQPVGSERTVRVDVRLMASSNRPFDELSSGGVLRHDLLHRLAAFVVHKQPLRARPADIAPLACMFLERLFPNARSRPSLSAAALRRLEAYAYPGNVRELRQILVRAAAHADGLRIGALAVEIALADSPLGGAISADAAMNSADVTLAGVIRRHLAATLDSTCGNLSAAARSLDVPRSTLQHYLSKFEIERADPQSSSRSA
jgi:DNA-binding NtrC family response regulator